MSSYVFELSDVSIANGDNILHINNSDSVFGAIPGSMLWIDSYRPRFVQSVDNTARTVTLTANWDGDDVVNKPATIAPFPSLADQQKAVKQLANTAQSATTIIDRYSNLIDLLDRVESKLTLSSLINSTLESVSVGEAAVLIGVDSVGDSPLSIWELTGNTGIPSEGPIARNDDSAVDALGRVWVLRHSGEIQPEIFSSDHDSFDDVITLINTLSAKYVRAMDSSESSRLGIVTSGLKISFRQHYTFSNTLVIYPGVHYEISKGATLNAAVTGQTILKTVDKETYQAALGVPYYDKKGVRVDGGGVVDGHYKASVGAMWDTIAVKSTIDINIFRCTHRRWSTAISTTKDSNIATLASADNAQKYDVIWIPNDDTEFYIIIELDGLQATLHRGARATQSTYCTHLAVGSICLMAQQSLMNMQISYCDAGEVYGKNEDGYDCTDMELMGVSRRNNFGLISLGLSGSAAIGKTVQKCFNRELVLVNGQANNFTRLYCESLSDNHADTLSPPTGGQPVTAADLRTRPMIDIKSPYQGLEFISLRWPINSGGTAFRRVIYNAGTNTVVQGCFTQADSRNENPDAAGDYAPFVQDSNLGNIRISDFTGPTNIQEFHTKLIVDENGGVPESYRASWSVMFNGKPYSFEQDVTYYGENNSRVIHQYHVKGEDYPRLGISAGKISFSNGEQPLLELIRYGNGGLQIEKLLNLGNEPGSFFRSQSPNGVWHYLWADDTGKWRTSNTEPSDRNLDGSII